MSDKKREEQIKEAAEKATYQEPPQYSELVHKTSKVMSAYEVGFIDGCVWADSHPQWIPVEKELPKHNVEGNGLITYQEVLVSLYDGYVDTDTYDTQLKAWWQYEGEVEYWMPKPQPPRKED